MSLRKIILILLYFPVTQGVSASTYNFPVKWDAGTLNGQVAANCTVTMPDITPFKSPAKTLVIAGNSTLPAGSVVRDWSYGAFGDPIRLSCISTNTSNSATLTSNSRPSIHLIVSDSASVSLSDAVGLNVWAKLSSSVNSTSGFETSVSNGTNFTNPPGGTEFELTNNSISYGTIRLQLRPIYDTGTGKWIINSFNETIQYRASLVRTNGTMLYKSTPLQSSGNGLRAYARTGTSETVNLTTGNALTVVAPTCRLKTKNYTVPMGDWQIMAGSGSPGSPVYGQYERIDLQLECSGKARRMRYRFKDAGIGTSANNNITLYDAVSGTLITGLEIELWHNTDRVKVNNIYEVYVMNYGQNKVQADDMPTFDFNGTESFTARYVQDAEIKKGSVPFTGPITGKIEMTVIYE